MFFFAFLHFFYFIIYSIFLILCIQFSYCLHIVCISLDYGATKASECSAIV